MKKLFFYFTFIPFFIISCSKADLTEKKDNSLLQRQSSYFDYVESTQIGNRIDCQNNILIFPSWDKYWETIDRLDTMIDNECDAFDATIPNNASNDQYDTMADAVGFDEDNVLRKFENDLEFC